MVNVRFWKGVFLLAGMIIGAGMFGIPYTFAGAGFWLGVFELILLTGVIIGFHLAYGDIVLATPVRHRLPGYIRLYLGPRAAAVSWGTALLGIFGALIAYIALGANFLSTLLGLAGIDASVVLLGFVITLSGAALTRLSIAKEAAINAVLTVVLIAFILVLAVFLFPFFAPGNVSGIRVGRAFLPYGVLLFALAGNTVIPDVISVLGRDRRRARRAIIIGTVLPAAVYFLFALAVVGALGSGASKETIGGLSHLDGTIFILTGVLIGFLAVYTSFIALSRSMQELFVLDFGLGRVWSWLVVSAAPFIFFLLGLRDFLMIIGAVGAIAVGIDAGLVFAARRRIAKNGIPHASVLSVVGYALIYLLILAGIVMEILKIIQ
ncbi:MAG: aromatic amino acid transport family protein [Patescibacteria group bacterium]